MSLEDKYDDSPNYYNWVDTYPQLKILLDNLDVLKADAKLINTVNKKMKQILHQKFSAILYIISIYFFVFASGTARTRFVCFHSCSARTRCFFYSCSYYFMDLQWIPWPEDHYTRTDGGKTDWTVFPFLHTFPATDISKSSWIQSTNLHCARTSELLKQVRRNEIR